MKPPLDHDWTPDAHLLAAYFDGELDHRPDRAALRLRIEAWLEHHPQEEEAAERLRKLWLETAPPEPGSADWSAAWGRIEETSRQRSAASASRQPWLTASACAVGLMLLSGMLFGVWRWSSSSRAEQQAIAMKDMPQTIANNDEDVLPVAQADEVLILRVEGEDTGALVVGELPLQGPLELAAPGEIRVFHVLPDQRDKMLPRVQQDGPERPLIWARLDTEND